MQSNWERSVNNILPSEKLQDFIKTIRSYETTYELSFETVGLEDKKLQDLLHEIELSANAKERNRAAAKLKDSRKARRAAKDEVLMLENIVKFFEEPQNRKVLNQMGQLLGRQKKQEKMILSERTYTPRVKEEDKGNRK